MRRGRGKRIALGAGGLALMIFGLNAWRARPHTPSWGLFEPVGPNAQGFPEYRHQPTGIVFVKLPGGKFWMGAQKEDPNGPNYDPGAREDKGAIHDAERRIYLDEGPVHEVELRPFLIAKYEVSQAEWKRVMGTSPGHFKGATLPVEQVSWEDCREFCRKAGFKLPTEAQWEFACRAGTQGPYGGTGRPDDMGWHSENSGIITHPVGQKQPNGFGLHDIHGNVSEWCEDVYDEGFYSTPEAAGLDPVCTSGSERRVFRGGTFRDFHDVARCAYRCRLHPTSRHHFLGFRVVASPSPSDP